MAFCRQHPKWDQNPWFVPKMMTWPFHLGVLPRFLALRALKCLSPFNRYFQNELYTHWIVKWWNISCFERRVIELQRFQFTKCYVTRWWQPGNHLLYSYLFSPASNIFYESMDYPQLIFCIYQINYPQAVNCA